MSIKSILSACGGDASRGSGLRHVLHPAKHHDAWLTVVLRHSQSKLERTQRETVPSGFLKAFFEPEQTRIEESAERFRTITAEAGFTDRSDFIDLSADRGMPLSSFARAFKHRKFSHDIFGGVTTDVI